VESPEATVEFTLPATAENVPLLRHALAGLGEALEMEGAAIADLKTVVTEACMNVVSHAYDEDASPGPLEVSASVGEQTLEVAVRDYGQGIRPLADVERRSLRLGLPLIAALTESFEVRSGGSELGTRIVMRMPLTADGDSLAGELPEVRETNISAPAGELLGSILSRVISMFAARADFSVDKLSDAVLLSDAISSQGPDGFPEGTARVAVREGDGAFTIRVGPLEEGAGQRLLDGMRIPELDATLQGLADEVRVEPGEDAEHVIITISQPGAA